ncbi:MAG: MarR family transcriptional regulator [Thermoflexibacter sp.]|jgi:DNA-binding MarR family transcriptional regulator|nr:MarR family transcriptional regulator [Thermoflexibacter sp.]
MKSKTLEESIVLHILEVAAQMAQKGDIITNRVGITTQQWIVMLYIYGDPNIPNIDKKLTNETGVLASDIASALNVSRPNITNLVNSLVSKGLIYQEADAEDRRRKLLKISEQGLELLQQLEPFRRKANSMLFSKFTKEELSSILKDLQIILARLRK